MVLGFLKSNHAPIAIDFGYSCVKLLQVGPGERPALVSAACAEIPESARQDQGARQDFLAEQLPRMLRNGKFRSRVAVCSIPAWQTFVQHLRIPKSEEGELNAAITTELQTVIECDPESVVIRHFKVGDTFKNSQPAIEVLCVAVARDVVMKQLELLRKCKLEIGGLHAEPVAILRCFDYIHQRSSDRDLTTLYVDIGANCSRAVISHGNELKFARSIPIGGRHFDQRCSDRFGCDVIAARQRRIAISQRGFQESDRVLYSTASVKSGNGVARGAAVRGGADHPSGSGAVTAVDRRRHGMAAGVLSTFPGRVVDGPISDRHGIAGGTGDDASIQEACSGLVEQLTDELKMCLRYHRCLFPDRYVDRILFLGGESRDGVTCRQVAEALALPAFLADPLRRLSKDGSESICGLEGLQREPGWTVPMGLCNCPVDV